MVTLVEMITVEIWHISSLCKLGHPNSWDYLYKTKTIDKEELFDLVSNMDKCYLIRIVD